MTPKARTTKSKARVSAYDKLFTAEFEKYRDELEISIPNAPRLGDRVIEFKNVSKG